MLRLCTSLAAVFFTCYVATAGGAVGYPTPEQLSRCQDAWNQPFVDGRCLQMKTRCEQSGGAFSIVLGPADFGSDGVRLTKMKAQCNKSR
jgi:hypothetical protein